MDIMPEIMDGKNVADFIDPDIAEKLEALEREEEKLQAEGFYDSEEDMVGLALYFVPLVLTP
jgi:nucleolar GTP-binding protein